MYLSVVLALAMLSAMAQTQSKAAGASIRGTVRDAEGRAVADAEVQLQSSDLMRSLRTRTSPDGKYLFSGLNEGVYSVCVLAGGRKSVEISSLVVGATDVKTVDLMLKASENAPQFFDEPQFTVSGVTDTTNLGGHGSDAVVRTRDSLAKETATLAHPATKAGSASATEKSLREELGHEPASFEVNQQLGRLLLENNRAEEAIQYLRRALEIQPGSAEAHHWLADAEEKSGDPLEAVRQYQRAAEIDASEPYLFDWGAELLLHHAPEPAVDVFTKGNFRYPKSVRMLVGLGAAWFARGANEPAVQKICEASDLNPQDPTPYLFLGKMLRVEGRPSQLEMDKLHRFVLEQPQNADASYYYAVALWKTRKEANDPAVSQAEALLQRAIELKPQFAAAHLQLGTLHADRRQYEKAISDFRQAIEIDPRLEEAHFRLGQVYRQAGEVEKSKQELRLHRQLAQESAQQVERERHEIRQFVYTLRDQPSH